MLQIRDASCGDDDDAFGVESSGANVVLYVGLGLVCVGLVISFVGLGEKGFKTAELRLIGPSLLAAGALFCLLRVLFCTCPAICCCCCPNERRRRRKRKKRRRKLRGEQVSSSDDEIIVNKQAKSILAGGSSVIGGGSVVLNVKPAIVNGDKHVVIPIKRQPPTPAPSSPSTMRVHSVNVQSPTTVTLPNYICEDELMGKVNPDPDAHILEIPTTSRNLHNTLQPPSQTSNPATQKTFNKLQRPREKELVLNASML
ncbi:hypothetical protein B566_EDAN011353 [Ephemera danica]|nr:hypothetical protein B566_EDAN011353 [Ephemera danica]